MPAHEQRRKEEHTEIGRQKPPIETWYSFCAEDFGDTGECAPAACRARELQASLDKPYRIRRSRRGQACAYGRREMHQG